MSETLANRLAYDALELLRDTKKRPTVKEFKVWLLIDETGRYCVGRNHNEAANDWCERFGDMSTNCKTVCVKISTEVPQREFIDVFPASNVKVLREK